MSRAVIGIDPGLDGALALVYAPLGLVRVEDMPTLRIKAKGNGARVVDAVGLAGLIDAWLKDYPLAEVYLELVASSSQMGVASAFNFGEGFGIVRGVIAAHFLPLTTVTPAKWKKAMGVNASKDSSRAKALSLWPAMASRFARKMDADRAEAALIALYGWQQVRGWVTTPADAPSHAVLL